MSPRGKRGRQPKRAGSQLGAISAVGGWIEGEFLLKAASGAASAQGKADYGISRSLEFEEELARSWKIAKDLWARSADVGPLLEQALGFRLEPCPQLAVAERSFPLSYLAQGSLPVLLRGAPLDKPADFGESGRHTPFELMRQLVSSGSFRWALVGDPKRLRLLHSSASLTRPAYLDVDLERIFTEELQSEFAALWRLLHGSRFLQVQGRCLWDSWLQEAQVSGQRALEQLRAGVRSALGYLGDGFLAAASNDPLRGRLAEGTLSAEAYFQQLLRLIYRMLFLLVTESRGLLHPEAATAEQREIYRKGYALSRLLERARLRQLDLHGDLWEGLQVVFAGLAGGQSALGLPALGGLFAKELCPDLDAAGLPNADLLLAVGALGFASHAKALQSRVNYRDLDTEELGSVYEGLLELRPQLAVQDGRWRFQLGEEGTSAKGSARKLTGSYYTPDALVRELVHSALDPLVDQVLASKPADPGEALLALKVVDPACGSGHFLLAAARRLAEHVAAVGLLAPQHALREVVRRCIYGVDQNPLAAELCRVALWIESVEPGKPLGLLEYHVRCGNSLVGAWEDPLGVPPEAFGALPGDDKLVIRRLKADNHRVAVGIDRLLDYRQGELTYQVQETLALPEESLADQQRKRLRLEELYQNPDYHRLKLLRDAWCAAFFLPKREGAPVLTSTQLEILRFGPQRESLAPLHQAISEIAREQAFFHWSLMFPEVFERGGFDCVLGNPPWERLEVQEQEFFKGRLPELAAEKNVHRKQAIKELAESNPALYADYQEALHASAALKQFLGGSGLYPLSAGGNTNTYLFFAELALRLLREGGRLGILVPSGVATDWASQPFFAALVGQRKLVSLFDFENREGLFPAVDSRQRFCLLTAQRARASTLPDFAVYLASPEDLGDPRRHYALGPTELRLFNPNSGSLPLLRSQRDLWLAKKIYQRVPVLWEETGGNPWGLSFFMMFQMSADAPLFSDQGVPLVEAKMFWQYDHRYADMEGDRSAAPADRTAPIRPRYWVPQREVESRLAARGWDKPYLIAWRDIARATDERTVIATVLPRVGTGHTAPLLLSDQPVPLQLCLLANLNSLVLDYCARQKLGGTHVTYHYLKQFPALHPEHYRPEDLLYIVPRVAELVYTARDLDGFAALLKEEARGDLATALASLQPGQPYVFDGERRALLRAELDAYYARLYGLNEEELSFILDPESVEPGYPSETFRVLKEKERSPSKFGRYRTMELTLGAYRDRDLLAQD